MSGIIRKRIETIDDNISNLQLIIDETIDQYKSKELSLTEFVETMTDLTDDMVRAEYNRIHLIKRT